MKILTIDEDALFTCTPKCLENFPRIQSVSDYKDLKKIKSSWDDFYDVYEASFRLKLNSFLIPIYFSPTIRNAKRVKRISTHDEILDILSHYNIEELYLVNVDQHHDQSFLHSKVADCSNWAYPDMIQSACSRLKTYHYTWIHSPITSDFECCRSYEGLNYEFTCDRIENFWFYFKEDFDFVIFCKSLAYVPSNYWDLFSTLLVYVRCFR